MIWEPKSKFGLSKHLVDRAHRTAEQRTAQRHEPDSNGHIYTLLMDLDGASSIGGVQHDCRVLGEDGDLICGDDCVIAKAYAQIEADSQRTAALGRFLPVAPAASVQLGNLLCWLDRLESAETGPLR